MDEIVLVDTDGSVIGAAQGPAAWAAFVNGTMYSGCLPAMGNNHAELTAIGIGLLLAPAGAKVLLWTDSKWALDWIHRRKPVSNPHILKTLKWVREVIYLQEFESLTWQLVKGHGDNITHNRVDAEAHRMANFAFNLKFR